MICKECGLQFVHLLGLIKNYFSFPAFKSVHHDAFLVMFRTELGNCLIGQ